MLCTLNAKKAITPTASHTLIGLSRHLRVAYPCSDTRRWLSMCKHCSFIGENSIRCFYRRVMAVRQAIKLDVSFLSWLFNDDVSTETIQRRMLGLLMMMEENGSGLSENYPGICLETEEIHKNLSRGRRCLNTSLMQVSGCYRYSKLSGNLDIIYLMRIRTRIIMVIETNQQTNRLITQRNY
jgi:hypothetical protein